MSVLYKYYYIYILTFVLPSVHNSFNLQMINREKNNRTLLTMFRGFLNFSFQLAQNWIESIQNKELQAAEGQEIEPPTSEDIMNELQRCVSANLKYFEERFTALDYASIGVVPKDDFRDILASVAFNLTNDQVRG